MSELSMHSNHNLRVDWESIFRDLRREGLTYDSISRSLNIPKATLHSWSRGTEPRYQDGEALLRLWKSIFPDLGPHLPRGSETGARIYRQR